MLRAPSRTSTDSARSLPDALEWKSSGYCITCPRDGFLVVGDEIIETPMAWRCRYFEGFAYRSLFKEYFQRGRALDRRSQAGAPRTSSTTTSFTDARARRAPALHHQRARARLRRGRLRALRARSSSCIKQQRHQRLRGSTWLRRHLGDEYRIQRDRERSPASRCTSTRASCPWRRASCSSTPNTSTRTGCPPIFKSWEVLVAPEPDPLPNKFLALPCAATGSA